MMHPTDATYVAVLSPIAAVARALRRSLPPAWRLRLEARPPDNVSSGWVWLHAVSVGELILARGLTEKLLDAHHRVHITTGTPAGMILLQERAKQWDQGRGLLSGGAFPVDDPVGLRPFLRIPPGAFIALETELWPNLMRKLEARGVPRVIVNGRLTERSLGLGGKWLRRAAKRLSFVAARDPESVEAFRALGAPNIALGGNLKADLPAPEPLAATWAALRLGWQGDPVIVAGSTLEGEESLILKVWGKLRPAHPYLRLMLAPRQPARFSAAASILKEQDCVFRRASELPQADPAEWRRTDILLLDTLGELSAAYGEGTLALVGGGWRGEGGHNPIEPVRWGIPTLIGPGFQNFRDLVEPLKATGQVRVVESSQLAAEVQGVLDSAPVRGPGPAGAAPLPPGLSGALENTWRLLQPFLPPHG